MPTDLLSICVRKEKSLEDTILYLNQLKKYDLIVLYTVRHHVDGFHTIIVRIREEHHAQISKELQKIYKKDLES